MERTGLLPFKIGTLNRINYPQIISSATNAKTVSVADVSLSYLTVTINKVHKTKKFSTLKVLGFAPFRVMPKFKTFLTFFIFSYNFKNASKKITEAHFFVNLGFLICCFLQHLSSDCINRKYLWALPTLTTFEKVNQTFTIA